MSRRSGDISLFRHFEGELAFASLGPLYLLKTCASVRNLPGKRDPAKERTSD